MSSRSVSRHLEVKAWARHYVKVGLANKTVRWVNYRDFVPHWATAKTIGNGHAGLTNYIDWPQNKVLTLKALSRRDFLAGLFDHGMTRYAMRIWYLMPAKYRKGLRTPRNFLGEINGKAGEF